MAKSSLIDYANLAANMRQSRDSAAAKAASTEALAKVEELLEKEQERETREELEREKAELHSRRQKEIKDTVFEVKQELDDLEEMEDGVARVVVLSVLESQVEGVSLDEFESLPDREYASEVVNRLETMVDQTESALTKTEQKQVQSLGDAFEAMGRIAVEKEEIQAEVEELESQLAELSETVDPLEALVGADHREEELARVEKDRKENRSAGFGGLLFAMVTGGCCAALDWNTAAVLVGGPFGCLACVWLLKSILRTPTRWLHERGSERQLNPESRAGLASRSRIIWTNRCA